MPHDREEWGEMHGYVRIRCRIHGTSWSDGGICEYCDDRIHDEEQRVCVVCGEPATEGYYCSPKCQEQDEED